PSPVSIEEHAEPQFDFISWLGIYRIATPGIRGGDNATVRLLLGANIPQPDACLWIHGGQCKVGEDGYLLGGPDVVGEIAASSLSHDLGVKLRAYERNGVREYIVWRVEEKLSSWYYLQKSEFQPLARSA